HNITELLRLAEPNAPTIANDLAAATRLTPFAVEGRYAVDAPPVAQLEATRQLDLARRVLETVGTLLKPYLEVEPPGAQG
ncbi:MAG: hypothetical protein ACRDGN_16260, partial [bacterium]